MQYTTLGRTGLRVSRVGLGAGGPSRLGRSRDATLDDMDRLIGRALDLGVNFIDTARTYGTEDAIGRALQGRDADDVIVATKVWLYDWADGENPQRKPHTDPRLVIDLGGGEPARPAPGADRPVPCTTGCRRPPSTPSSSACCRWPSGSASRARCASSGSPSSPCSTSPQDMAARACASGPVGLGGWCSTASSTRPAAPRAFPPARANGAGVICMSAARGALVSEEALARTLEKLDAGTPDDMRFLLGEPPGTWAELAFRFAAACEEIDVVLVGTGDPEHFEAAARAITGPPLPPEHLEWLRDRFGRCRGEALWPE